MRILVTIPHYYKAADSTAVRVHGSLGRDPRARVLRPGVVHRCSASALRRVAVLLRLGPKDHLPGHDALPHYQVDVVVCTTRGRHLLPRLSLPAGTFMHQPTDAEPLLLGFECHAALLERIGDYDYYCYLEDDLVVTDPWLFAKLCWFAASSARRAPAQPLRGRQRRRRLKAYLDGDLAPEVAARSRTAPMRPNCSAFPVDARRPPAQPAFRLLLPEASIRCVTGPFGPIFLIATAGSSAPGMPRAWASCVPFASTNQPRGRQLPGDRPLRPRVPRLAVPSRGCTLCGGGLGRMTIPALSLLSG